MLTNLSVRNFALFDELLVDFQPGFNVLTGETGAGKSILIDAFNIALGGKASADYIRLGKEFFLVQAVFDISGLDAAQKLLDGLGIEYPDNELILSRKIAAAGKGVSTANGIRIPAGVLKNIGDLLVDVHGQYENQQLLKQDTYLGLIDGHAGPDGEKLLKEYKEIFTALKNTVKQIRQNEANAVERERKLDILAWEIDEIEKAGLKAGEDKSLEAKKIKLVNKEKILTALSGAYNIIDGEGGEGEGLSAGAAKLLKALDAAARYDTAAEKIRKTAEELSYALADIKTELAGRLDESETGGDLEMIEQRLDLIYRLKKKYGENIDDVLKYCSDAQKERETLLRAEESAGQLEERKLELAAKASALARDLSAQRARGAELFAARALEHIHDLAMPQARFVVEIKTKEALSETGQDEIQFLFSANAGQELRPLNKVASGGELSRIALSVKTVFMNEGGPPTMVFDEVDTGVGGKTAQRMAEKMAIIALKKQVLCITHLPQIACMADCHIYIDKKEDGLTTWIEIEKLGEQARVSELTRMVAGDSQTQIARDNARQMLEMAAQRKEHLRVQNTGK